MTAGVQIALVGDYNPHVHAHVAIPAALSLAAMGGRDVVKPRWIATPELESDAAPLREVAGIWCVPGSPYASMEGALRAIRFARENGVPFLGTCGGFQHAVIEFARNVLGLPNAGHGESDPEAALLLVTRLACSLHETKGRVYLKQGSRSHSIYGCDEATEAFNCGYGMNAEHAHRFANSSLHVAGTAADGAIQLVELHGHPFFIAALFQPERSAFDLARHPLISAFVHAALTR